ncbi:GNAT family N-acetyltransferase [Chitinophaga polysaccharea]|uniref:GNAT family N-acetyltransferase n=1 Tax=Chitinophaga polysaccharea TaxID=1293035 RepID=UPI00115C3221|nr:GNAT family N-acetyltransferase [Chitinophaga polysaccharea]
MPSETHLQKVLSGETFFSFVAVYDNKIIGGLTCYILPAYYVTSSYVYIFDLAVFPVFQRKGIGRMLIESVKEYSKSLGYEEVFVQADVEDQYAVDFYRATGGFEEQTMSFSYPLINKQ